MKIGVLTYHKEISQGATFQAYATYRALRELGCEVEVIDLAHDVKSPRPRWQVLLMDLYLSLSRYRQESFRRNYYPTYSKHYNTIDDLQTDPPKVDAICVGSDQTWNIDIATKRNMPAFFLDFGNLNLPRFSYAPSFGYSKWQIDDEDETQRIGKILREYIGLSVREKTGQNILKEKFNLNAELVCDPTLLHTRYDEFTEGLKQKNEVLCYSLATSSSPKNLAIKDISEFVGAPIRWMGKPYFVRGARYTYFPDVYRWYRYIARSRFVLTDSFHGTVASILCHKPFAVLYEENGLSSRIVDLLNMVNLQDRMYFNYEDFATSDAWKTPINYMEVDKKLEKYRQSSWDFLRQTLNEIKEKQGDNQ